MMYLIECFIYGDIRICLVVVGSAISNKFNVRSKIGCWGIKSFRPSTPQRLDQAGEAIISLQPDYIMGYITGSLALLARENEDKTEAFHQIPLKAIIATTEAFIQTDDAKLIEQVFGCPVGMEYGAAETGVIAYTHPSDGRYRAFWDTYLLEANPLTIQKQNYC